MHSQDIKHLKTQFEILIARGLPHHELLAKNYEFLHGIDVAGQLDEWDDLTVEEKNEVWALFDEAIEFAEEQEAEDAYWESPRPVGYDTVWNKSQLGVQ